MKGSIKIVNKEIVTLLSSGCACACGVISAELFQYSDSNFVFAWVCERERVTVSVYECVLGTSAPLLIFRCSQDLVVSRLCLSRLSCSCWWLDCG